MVKQLLEVEKLNKNLVNKLLLLQSTLINLPIWCYDIECLQLQILFLLQYDEFQQIHPTGFLFEHTPTV